MNALLVVLLAGRVSFAPHPAVAPEKLASDFTNKCAGGKSTPDCVTMRAQVEGALLDTLQGLEAEGEPLDRDVLRAAAGAHDARLKIYALEHIQRQGQITSADEPPIIADLNDPSAGVRERAFQLAGQLHDEKYTRWQQRNTNRSIGGEDNLRELYEVMPQNPPDSKQLAGAPTYPGATYLYFASDAHKRFWFNTADSEDKVIAALSRGGKPVMTADQLEQASQAALSAYQQQAMANPMAMAQAMQQAMQQGKDPAQAMAELQKGQTSMMAGMAATEAIKDDQGLEKVKYVVLEQTKTPAGQSAPSKLVAVAQDSVLGGTSIIYFPPPPDSSAALSKVMSGKSPSNDDVQLQIRLQQMKAQPDVFDDGSWLDHQ